MSQKKEGSKGLVESIRAHTSSGNLYSKKCSHMKLIQEVSPNTQGCEECLAMGDTWVHLRMCMICGHVGCCNESKNKHATKHFHSTGHPIIKSLELSEDWMWCYVDETKVLSV